MITLSKLGKIYTGSSKAAVRDLNLQIDKGDIFGLLGPNGAGKTTTISMICGLLSPGAGKIEFDINDQLISEPPLEHLGLAPQEIALYPTLTAKENLRFYGGQYRIPRNILDQRIDDLITRFELKEHLDKKIRAFSGGMKRRINLIVAVLHQPTLLILDEPTSGVDVHSRKVIHDFIREENKAGLTVLYTSHHLDEAEKLCNRLAIMDHGNIIDEGSAEQLKEKHNARDLDEVFITITGRKPRDN
jgi:ABC-2 type transport system ATP-binding protein